MIRWLTLFVLFILAYFSLLMCWWRMIAGLYDFYHDDPAEPPTLGDLAILFLPPLAFLMVGIGFSVFQ